MNEIELTRSQVKALLSDVRIKILEALKQRQKTVTELASEFQMSKSTIHGHLKALLEAGLIEKSPQYTEKWVYYELTRKGNKIVSDEKTKIVLILVTTLIAVFGLGYIFFFQFGIPINQISPGGTIQSLDSGLTAPELGRASLPAEDSITAASAAEESSKKAVVSPGGTIAGIESGTAVGAAPVDGNAVDSNSEK